MGQGERCAIGGRQLRVGSYELEDFAIHCRLQTEDFDAFH
jgi:hypothetical protein